MAGGVSIILDSNNITIIANTLMIKSGQSIYGAGSGNSAELQALPSSESKNSLELNYHYDDLQAVAGAPYKVLFADGSVREGKLDNKGYAKLENVPSGEAKIYYGEDPKPYVRNSPENLHEEVSLDTTQDNDDLWGFLEESDIKDIQQKLQKEE